MNKLETFSLENFGPIKKVEVDFGDLTVLIGPQATGKSLFLQMHKWHRDAKSILEFKTSTAFEWPKTVADMLRLYLGEESGGLIKPETRMIGKPIEIPERAKGSFLESVVYIPANRDSIFYNNFPRHPDIGFLPFDPYVTRFLSQLVIDYFVKMTEGTPGGKEPLFWYNNAIYYQSKPFLEVRIQQNRISIPQDGNIIRYSDWSFGMKSFLPIISCAEPFLRFGKANGVEYFVVEEPEIGLHPKAIQDFILLVFELMAIGFKVILSTHSDYILEIMWVLNQISANQENRFDLLTHLLQTENRPKYNSIFTALASKTFRTYSFSKSSNGMGVVAKDISSLDVLSEDSDISSWGGFMPFKDRANRIVAAVNKISY